MFYKSTFFNLIYLIILSAIAAILIVAIIINIIKIKDPKNTFTKASTVLSLIFIVITVLLALLLVFKEFNIFEINVLEKVYIVYSYNLINLIHGVIISAAVLCLIVCVFRPQQRNKNQKRNNNDMLDAAVGGIDEIIDNTSPVNDIFKDLGSDEKSIDAYIEGVTDSLKQKALKQADTDSYSTLIKDIEGTFENLSQRKKADKSKRK